MEEVVLKAVGHPEMSLVAMMWDGAASLCFAWAEPGCLHSPSHSSETPGSGRELLSILSWCSGHAGGKAGGHTSVGCYFNPAALRCQAGGKELGQGQADPSAFPDAFLEQACIPLLHATFSLTTVPKSTAENAPYR